MARPTIKELYGVEPSVFENMTAKEYIEKRIELLEEDKSKKVDVLFKLYKKKCSGIVCKQNSDYTQVSDLNNKLNYIDKALVANKSDYDEIWRKK